jgi:transcriptional regulator with XRE-family HTH domain
VSKATEAERNRARKQLQMLLGKILADAQKRERLLKSGINQSTLARWQSGESEPRWTSIQLILEHCQEEDRAALVPVIEQLWPLAWQQTITHDSAQINPAAIPSAFYSRILLTLAETPDSLRYLSICHLVLHQALQHLDPDREGMHISVIRCMPSVIDNRIRYLRESAGLGTLSTASGLETDGALFGAESLAGEAVSSYQLVTRQGCSSSGYSEAEVGSAVATPILRAGRISGCLLVESQSLCLSPEVCALIKEYALLIALAFDSKDFFDQAALSLSVMPSKPIQQPLLASLHERKIALMRAGGMESRQAENLALQQIVDELTRSPSRLDRQSTDA